MRGSPPLHRATVRPSVDILETPDELLLIADVPGADEDSLELTLVDDVLTLYATPVASALPSGWGSATGAGEPELPDYARAFHLASEIEHSSIHASIANGRLRVVLRKLRPAIQRVAVGG